MQAVPWRVAQCLQPLVQYRPFQPDDKSGGVALDEELQATIGNVNQFADRKIGHCGLENISHLISPCLINLTELRHQLEKRSPVARGELATGQGDTLLAGFFASRPTDFTPTPLLSLLPSVRQATIAAFGFPYSIFFRSRHCLFPYDTTTSDEA